MFENDWQTAGFRLLIALLLGGVIGLERQIRQKSAGLRTHMMVSMGSALFMEISLAIPTVTGATFSDPARIGAQIITGIGFLGAGTILHARGFVVGLTTAASIWLAAAIGMGVGAGMYAAPVLATGLGTITLVTSHLLEGRMSRNERVQHLIVQMTGLETPSEVQRAIEEFELELLRSRTSSKGELITVEIDLRMALEDQTRLTEAIRQISGVESTRIEG